MKSLRSITFFLHFMLMQSILFSQSNTYILNGSAIQNTCNCYTLTPALNGQSGSVWNATKINLNNPFDYIFNIFLGCADSSGADGIVFILQPISTSVGTSGEGMGFEGITPSIGISLDTWQNPNRNDPYYDHISIQMNGVVTHGADLAGPIQASTTSINIEDCKWHTLRITWDPGTRVLKSYFDGVLRVEMTKDLIGSVFNNDPMVYWGFSAATGGANNEQRFCTALNPDFGTNAINNGVCYGTPLIVTNNSQSFAPIASYYWNFGDGTTSTLANPPPHTYTAPGIYEVRLMITGLDGCRSDTLLKTISVGDFPRADFEIRDTCFGSPPAISDLSRVSVGNIAFWNWSVDGSPVSVSQIPQLSNLSPGSHQLQLTVNSSFGCPSQPVVKTFTINPIPQISGEGENGCLDELITFRSWQTDNATTIVSWHWDFGNGQTSSSQQTQQLFTAGDNFSANVYAVSDEGCRSNIVNVPVNIQSVFANAGNDTVVILNVPFQFQSSFGTLGNTNLPTFSWTPSVGLINPSSLAPTVTLQNDQTYYFTVTTSAGCKATDTIHLTVFKGSAVYVPSGFTPNNDGKNELLKPYYAGIKSLDYFTVYNRWGQQVFSTKNMGEGWNGVFKGIVQQTGTFVWILRATDYVGKVYELKGTSTLIR